MEIHELLQLFDSKNKNVQTINHESSCMMLEIDLIPSDPR